MNEYILPSKWVGLAYFESVTGHGRAKIQKYADAGLIEIKKSGKHVMVNLANFNDSMDKGLFEDIDFQNVYK